jgi:hypothetical protein
MATTDHGFRFSIMSRRPRKSQNRQDRQRGGPVTGRRLGRRRGEGRLEPLLNRYQSLRDWCHFRLPHESAGCTIALDRESNKVEKPLITCCLPRFWIPWCCVGGTAKDVEMGPCPLDAVFRILCGRKRHRLCKSKFLMSIIILWMDSINMILD